LSTNGGGRTLRARRRFFKKFLKFLRKFLPKSTIRSLFASARLVENENFFKIKKSSEIDDRRRARRQTAKRVGAFCDELSFGCPDFVGRKENNE